MIGQIYISALFVLLACGFLWAGFSVSMRFILMQYISILNDKLSIMAIKHPEISNDREFNYAMMMSHANLVAARMGTTFLVGQYYSDVDTALEKGYGVNASQLVISKIKNAEIRPLVIRSCFAFILLLIFGRIHDVRAFISCVIVAIKQARVSKTPFSIAAADCSGKFSQFNAAAMHDCSAI